jgi:hypothetical protein
MSFSECQSLMNSPRQSNVITSLRNRYTLLCMNKDDEELDNDYPNLFQKLQKLKIDVDKAFNKKFLSPSY